MAGRAGLHPRTLLLRIVLPSPDQQSRLLPASMFHSRRSRPDSGCTASTSFAVNSPCSARREEWASRQKRSACLLRSLLGSRCWVRNCLGQASVVSISTARTAAPKCGGASTHFASNTGLLSRTYAGCGWLAQMIGESKDFLSYVRKRATLISTSRGSLTLKGFLSRSALT